MSRANIRTLLSLDRAARMLNLSPVHFAGAYGSTVWPIGNTCPDLWPQHAWQSEELIVSREMFAEAIFDAEMDITNALGYAPAPMFFTKEPVPYKLRYDGAWQLNRRFHTKYGKVISGGIRGITEIETGVTVSYQDLDGDGWKEDASFVIATTVTDPREVKVYFPDEDGDPVWEIRPLKSVVISGGFATVHADSWLFINPVLWEAYPTINGFQGINISTDANFVDEVDVYREYVDTSAKGVQFFWSSGACCDGLALSTQDGTFLVIDENTGYIEPHPASYENDAWVKGYFNPNKPPTGFYTWYYAGLQDDRYIQNKSLDPLPEYWAQAIIWLAVSKLELPPCACGAAQNLFHEYRRDLAISTGRDRNLLSFETLDNPFGTRVGAIRAWTRIVKVAGDNYGSESI